MNRSEVRGRYGSWVTEAKDDAKAPAGPDSATPADADTTAEAESTDPRERFRAALERKNASPGTHPGSMANGGNSLKSSNGKTKRQFRRKSGG
jgi:hypothetical protein